MDKNAEIVIIGGGPGGYVAAIQAAQNNKKVLLIENDKLGGVCLNNGCIPTKSLLKSAEVYNLIKKSNDYGIHVDNFSFNWESILLNATKTIEKLNKGIQFLFKKNKIEILKGTASFIDNTSVSVLSSKKEYKVTGEKFIISTGSIPRDVKGIDIDNKNIINYRNILDIKKIPKDILIIGAGAIGVEYAFFLNSLGVQVTLAEIQKNILPNEDIEISKKLKSIFIDIGINIINEANIKGVSADNDSVSVTINNQNHIFNKLIVAVGVEGNYAELNLDNTDVIIENKFISVDENFKTRAENIYAIGDIVGAPWLAHLASAQGIYVANHICNQPTDKINLKKVPSCIYTTPQIASIGFTEQAAKQANMDYKIGKFSMSNLGKGLIDGDLEGFIKIIFDAKYGEILGCHILSNSASELISEIALAMESESTVYELINTIHPHPTISEAINEAALDSFGKSIHK